MMLYNWIDNQDIADFIKNNDHCGVVIQIKEANKNRDREMFSQLLKHIKHTLRMQDAIELHKCNIKRLEAEIANERREISKKKNLVKNGLNYHKIKRN